MNSRYKPGDPLRVFVLKVDRSRKRVQFTLLRSRFTEVAGIDDTAVDVTSPSEVLLPNRLQETLAQEGPEDSDESSVSEEEEFIERERPQVCKVHI